MKLHFVREVFSVKLSRHTYMDKSGDGPVPLSARIPRWLSVEVKVLPVKGRP